MSNPSTRFAATGAEALEPCRDGDAVITAAGMLGKLVPAVHQLVADSPSMRRLLACVDRVATKDVTILLSGETGTGLEVVASLLHARSDRAAKPLVRFNCAALASELAESELFGHVKAAFTGAAGEKRGCFAEADGGTLVLDEIGELGAGAQAALLRTLQNGEIQPVGASRTRRVDVRIIASTNRDLREEVRAGRFREHLYYRLAVVELLVPPLRERRVDIPGLAVEFARRESVEAFERQLIAAAFEAAQRNQSETARRLSVCRTTLIEKLKKHGLC
jgi:transcriptional regulator with GAF, ATPase, and Fis domain